MSKQCSFCNRELGIMSEKTRLKDGWICVDCWKRSGLSTLDVDFMIKVTKMTVQELHAVINERELHRNNILSYKPNYVPAQFAKFDDNSRVMLLTSKLYEEYLPEYYSAFSYDQLVDFELLEDGTGIASGGVGRAIVGGLLFGVTGAIVGATTRSSKPTCESLKIKLTIKNYSQSAFYISLIESGGLRKDSPAYKNIFGKSQNVISKFQLIVDELNKEPQRVSYNNMSGADELRKYKALLDDGIINEEEFNLKKRRILGI